MIFVQKSMKINFFFWTHIALDLSDIYTYTRKLTNTNETISSVNYGKLYR